MKFIILLFVLFTSIPVHALVICECADEKSVEVELDRAFAVFTGTVTQINRRINPDFHKIEFKVYKSWKGAKHEQISVFTSGTDLYALIKEGFTCGFRFEKDKKYIVYSFRKHNAQGPSYVSRCSRTQKIESAEDDIKLLGEPIISFHDKKPPKAHVPQIPKEFPKIKPLPEIKQIPKLSK